LLLLHAKWSLQRACLRGNVCFRYVAYAVRLVALVRESPTPYQSIPAGESYSFSPSLSHSLSILSPPTPDASSPTGDSCSPAPPLPHRRRTPEPARTESRASASLPPPPPSLSPAPSPHPPRSSGHLHHAELVLPPIDGGAVGSMSRSTRRPRSSAHLHAIARSSSSLPSAGGVSSSQARPQPHRWPPTPVPARPLCLSALQRCRRSSRRRR
jgi:hypothetical protein